MAQDVVVIVDAQGTEHEFPAGFDPVKAAGIVRTQAGGTETSDPNVAWWNSVKKTATDTAAGVGHGLLKAVDPRTYLGAMADKYAADNPSPAEVAARVARPSFSVSNIGPNVAEGLRGLQPLTTPEGGGQAIGALAAGLVGTQLPGPMRALARMPVRAPVGAALELGGEAMQHPLQLPGKAVAALGRRISNGAAQESGSLNARGFTSPAPPSPAYPLEVNATGDPAGLRGQPNISLSRTLDDVREHIHAPTLGDVYPPSHGPMTPELPAAWRHLPTDAEVRAIVQAKLKARK